MWTVRKKNNSKHPHVIKKSNRTKFESMELTHSPKSGHHANLKLPDNPDPNDKDDAYLKTYIHEDYKFNYSKAFKNYRLTDRTIEVINNYLIKKEKKK